MGNKFVDMIRKHLGLTRIPEYNLQRGADHLEKWIDGLLPLEEFGDVSVFPSNTADFPFFWQVLQPL